MDYIKIKRAKTHNLKSVSVNIPKEKIVVITGLSGSGKSSLAFDTIYAEGQRRYVDNLSSYAKQVIGVIERPDVESIEGISPAISIDQKSIARSPRSTVGTLTEIYDYLRILYSGFGKIMCPNCGGELKIGNAQEVKKEVYKFIIANLSLGQVEIFAPIVREQKGAHTITLNRLSRSDFASVKIDGVDAVREELQGLKLSKQEDHTIEVRIAHYAQNPNPTDDLKQRILSDIEKGFNLGDGFVSIYFNGKKKVFSRLSFCEKCDLIFANISPRIFSFNSPHGACSECQGLGIKKEIDPELVIPNKNLTLAEGAIRPWSRIANQASWYYKKLEELSEKYKFSLDIPVKDLPEKIMNIIYDGDGDFEGVIKSLEKKYQETDSEYLRTELEKYIKESICPLCEGKRLKKLALSVLIDRRNIADISQVSLKDLRDFLRQLKLPPQAGSVLEEVKLRLNNLINIGLGYLTVSRTSETLSGGEAQRIRLAVQLGSFISGVIYVLDEPTIGMHAYDTNKLINALNKLKKDKNSVIIVEHDRQVIKASDFVIDIGPGAGVNGGVIVSQGSPAEVEKDTKSLTGQYLSGKKVISRKKRVKAYKDSIVIKGARANNLRDIDVEIPLGMLVCVTGVSRSGKSTLVYDILARALSNKFHRTKQEPLEHDAIEGFEKVDKVIKIDQSSIGKTPRSNLATYTGLFTPIRELFAQTPEATLKGYNASQFSFNLKGGRCETCRGDGAIKIEMFFMPDTYVTCEDCMGKRYNRETLEVQYRNKNIADVLDMTVDEAGNFFEDNEDIMSKIKSLREVGLGYVRLGQPANTLSGGEAQRIKLATELSRPSTGKTLYILDEPTTGLHFEDVVKLMNVLSELVERGNSVLVIEHNMDVIKCSDWVIDMGPGAGDEGGKIVAVGSVDQISKNKNSKTAEFLR